MVPTGGILRRAIAVDYHHGVLRVFTDPRCLLHRTPPGYPERAERLAGVLDHLRGQRLEIIECSGHPAAQEVTAALHEPRYIERFRRAVERGDGLLDSADNPLSAGTWEAAWGAVGAALAAADWVVKGADRQALIAVRPPGHHAEAGLAMGFCFFNNIALAAERLVRAHGVERVAIYDFDVHHGNGTQHLFEDRSDVYYASTHQFPFYPGTGAAEERGLGPGEGYTLNVPLPAGSGDEGYAEALARPVLPALTRYEPQILLLSAGFDSWKRDPLGGMKVSEAGFSEWGRRLGALARTSCDGRVLAVLEGGYDVTALPHLVEVFLLGLSSGGA